MDLGTIPEVYTKVLDFSRSFKQNLRGLRSYLILTYPRYFNLRDCFSKQRIS